MFVGVHISCWKNKQQNLLSGSKGKLKDKIKSTLIKIDSTRTISTTPLPDQACFILEPPG